MSSEPEHPQGPLAKNRNKLLIIAIIAVIAVIGISVGTFEYTSTTNFCSQCHVMDPYYGTWAQSAHKDIHCYECHIDDGTVNYLKAKVNGLRELYVTVTGAEANPDDQSAWGRCKKCHSSLMEKPTQASNDSFEHYKHLQSGLTCKKCHGDPIHHKEVKITQQLCADCHKDMKVKPSTHDTPEFKVTHGRNLKNTESCGLCHNGLVQQTCNSCHGVSMPHQDKYVNQHVDQVKTYGQANCQKCHLDKPDNLPRNAKACNSCHGVQIPHPQGYLTQHSSVTNQQTAACLKCHKDKSEIPNSKAVACQKCHGVTMPHPADYVNKHAADSKTAGSVCLNCHKNDGQPRKAKTCQECHGVTLPHPSNYLTQHAKVVSSKGSAKCLNCHSANSTGDAKACQQCHGVTMPHAKNYTLQHTAVVKSTGTKVCLNCHVNDGLPRQAKACASCHKVSMPHANNYISQHMSIVKSTGSSVCINCHKSDGQKRLAQTCSSCHGVAMPHPDDWNHGQANLKTCSYCHSPSNPANPKASWASKNFCSDCHQKKPHGDNYLAGHTKDELDVTSCKKCHDWENDCRKCHQ